MSFSLLENGADSLKKAKESIEQYEVIIEEFSTHHMKDAVIYLHHSIEILLKYLLTLESEYLIFDKLHDFAIAKKELLDKQKEVAVAPKRFILHKEPKNYKTVFDVPKGKKLKTISLEEARIRVQYICEIDIPREFELAIVEIQSYRNQITHHTISLSSGEKAELISSLKILHDTTLMFFGKNIENFDETYHEQRFEISKEEWEDHQREMEEYFYDESMDRSVLGVEDFI